MGLEGEREQGLERAELGNIQGQQLKNPVPGDAGPLDPRQGVGGARFVVVARFGFEQLAQAGGEFGEGLVPLAKGLLGFRGEGVTLGEERFEQQLGLFLVAGAGEQLDDVLVEAKGAGTGGELRRERLIDAGGCQTPRSESGNRSRTGAGSRGAFRWSGAGAGVGN